MSRYIGYLAATLIVSLTLFASPSRGATTQAVLAWNASSDSSVIGYKVYMGTQSGDYQTPIDAGNNTTYTVTGLSDSQTYYFAVTAYSTSQESPYSQELVCDFITAGTTSNGQITPAGTTAVAGGGSQTYSIVPDSGYQIGTVTVDGQQVANPTSSYTFSSVSGCHTIAATFVPSTPSTYTITAGSQAGGTISPSGTVSVNAGANQTFTMTPATGYKISNVVVDGASAGAVSSYTFTNITANHSITASFTAVQYSISASVQGSGGTISPSGTSSVASGSSATYTITPATGYKISSVAVDGASAGAVSSYTFSNVTASHSITASFTAVQYSISASVQGSGGTISPSGTSSISYGSSATYTITPATGYKISSVAVDGASAGAVSSYTFTNVTASHSITASFTAVQYSISASVQGSGGTISPSGTTSFSAGTSPSYSMTPAAGCTLTSVLVDGNQVSSAQLQTSGTAGTLTYTFTDLESSHTICALFSPTSPLVADPGPDQQVQSGATVSLNGSNSTGSANSAIASFKWTQVSGPAVSLSKASSPQCTFSTKNIASVASLVFNLTVTNSAGASSSALCLVNVSPTGGGPAVTSGPDQTVSASTNVLLDGSSNSDTYGSITSYSWTQIAGPPVALSNANTAYASFAAPSTGTAGVTLTFQLTVQDQYGLKARGQWTVNVASDYQPPSANAGANISAASLKTVTLDATGSSDPAGASDTYRWKQISGVPVTLSDPTSLTPSYKAPNISSGQQSQQVFMVTVTDSVDQLSSTAKCTVTVTSGSNNLQSLGPKWSMSGK